VLARSPRRLPGVRFAAAPPPVDPLPRMDVALFVGFAAEGPLHVPVAVESGAEYAAVFGDDAVVAWDGARGEPVYAHLGPAVRAFFRNGGRRAWVVRVAGNTASANAFPVPGLLRLGEHGLMPALAQARSAGSWSDSLRTSAALLLNGVRTATIVSFSPPLIDLTTDASNEIFAGDLLRFTFRDAGLVWTVPVQSIALPPEDGGSRSAPLPPGSPRTFRIRAQSDNSFWFRTGPKAPQAGLAAVAFDGEVSRSPMPLRDDPSTHTSAIAWNGEEVTFELTPPFSGTIEEGAFLRIDLGAEELWVCVRTVRSSSDTTSTAIGITGRALRRLKAAPSTSTLAGEGPIVERLRVELWSRRGDAPPTRLGDLALGRRHPRFWGALPSDEQAYRAELVSLLPRGEILDDERWAPLWQAARVAQLPLAGDGHLSDVNESIYLPVGMSLTADDFLGAVDSAASAPIRDGLATQSDQLVAFDAIFLDPDLADTPLSTLLAQADFIRYQSPDLRPLLGIHAALAIEEATILAAPDIVQRRWSIPLSTSIDDGASSDPQAPAVRDGTFGDCRIPLDAPVFVRPVTADPSGTFTLRWSNALDPGDDHVPGQRYVVEESPNADFQPAEVIYDRVDPVLVIHGRPAGTWSYRVRIENEAGPGPWSARLSVRVAPAIQTVIEPAAAYDPSAFLRVQSAILRLCAARGDILALLGVPEHYREQETIAHAADLAHAVGNGSAAALGFGALYHPWLFTLEEAMVGSPICRNPPDGAIAGVIAQRAFSRGAWIAPANVPLRAVVALTPSIGRAAWQSLQDAQVNLIRQEPQGFLSLGEDTLSPDSDLMPIHVRRLLSLLRRAALELGATYVFEPNGGALRRMMQRGFEGLLGRMFARGAFAGRSESDSFQVVTGSVDPVRDAEAGRLVVDLRVAPSAALSFLTVRLVQTADRNQVTEVR
jgi:hypothetical protein